MQVLKIGGNDLDLPGFLERLGRLIGTMTETHLIVHGGGQIIADMETRLGNKSVKIDGLRVTDSQTLMISQMVLSGHVNKNIVAAMVAAGQDAIGISGVDGGLLRCVKKLHPSAELGYVGHVVEVNTGLLQGLIALGNLPVISPISLGVDGQIYNVNADEAAGAIAASLKVNSLTFISDVPGVLDQEERLIRELSAEQTLELIQRGVIRDGMVPKVKAALNVLDRGVYRTRITNLDGLAHDGGTWFVR